MPILEPGEYHSPSLDKLVITEEGEMILHIRVRSSGGHSVIHHYMGKAPATQDEGYARLCIEYLRMKFPSDLVDAFLQELGSSMEWSQYVDKDQLEQYRGRGPVGHYLYDILHTADLAQYFSDWYRERRP